MFLSSTARLRRRVAHALVLVTSRNPARGDAGNSGEDPAPIPSGGPFLHWVADRPDGLRLAGQYLPASMPPASQPVARQARRRR